MSMMVKYCIYYWRSHYHYLRIDTLSRKQSKNISSMSDRRFKRIGRRLLAHLERFDELQIQLDTLKELICNKYPDLRES